MIGCWIATIIGLGFIVLGFVFAYAIFKDSGFIGSFLVFFDDGRDGLCYSLWSG